MKSNSAKNKRKKRGKFTQSTALQLVGETFLATLSVRQIKQ